MRHLFIIQCCKYAQAVALGKLLEEISPTENGLPKWEIFYAYDIMCSDKELFESLPNAAGFRIGYCTIDQGMFHILLWKYISDHIESLDFDYYHLISESDLPFKKIFDIDNIVGDRDFYGYVSAYRLMFKAIAWYGMNKESVLDLGRGEVILDILQSFPNLWFTHAVTGGYTGGIDEYILARVLKKLSDLGHSTIPNCLRLVMYQESGKDATLATDGTPIDWYGRKSNSRTSPIILEDTPATNYAFENWNVLFGRKFQFESNSYAHFVKLIRDAKL